MSDYNEPDDRGNRYSLKIILETLNDRSTQYSSPNFHFQKSLNSFFNLVIKQIDYVVPLKRV